MLPKITVLVLLHLALCKGGVMKARLSPPQPAKEVWAVAKRELCPEGGGDTNAGCPYWRTLGYCDPSKGYLDYMEITCPVTCNICEARPTPPPTAALVKLNRRGCLRAHNAKRALHGARPLVWDNSLTRDAERWALKLASMNEFKHAPFSGQGENLYYISKVSPEPGTCEDAVQAWYDEVNDYPFHSPPNSIFDITDAQIGHFTQIVWKNTKRMGVAVSTIKRGLWYKTYIVARYTPPGNYNGQFSEQVGNIRKPGIWAY